MTIETWFFIVLLVGLSASLISGKVAIDLIALVVLTILSISGYLASDEAFRGFSSPVVVTLISLFIIGSAFRKTGSGEILGRGLARFVGASEVKALIGIMLISGVVLSFMNNVAVIALTLPIIASLAKQTGIPGSRLYLPLSIATLLGGTLTLIGTATNLTANQIVIESGLEPFTLFSFTPIGAVLIFVATIFMVTVGRTLLPSRKEGRDENDPASLYQLHERLFSLRLPTPSRLDGKTLADLSFGHVLGAEVVGIIHRGKRILAPHATDVVRAGDTLLVRGRLHELKSLFRFAGISKLGNKPLPKNLKNQTFKYNGTQSIALPSLEIRSRFGVTAGALWRRGKIRRSHLSRTMIKEGDLLWCVGTEEALLALASGESRLVAESESASIEASSTASLAIVRIPKGSLLSGETVRGSLLGQVLGLSVVAVTRDSESILPVRGETVLQGGDEIVVTGEPDQLERLSILAELEVIGEEPVQKLESEAIGIMEVVLAPRSKLLGQTVRETHFREKYDFTVLAVWRNGRPVRAHLGDMRLEFGDALLLLGPRSKMPFIARDPDFVALGNVPSDGIRPEKALIPLFALLMLVVIAAFSIVPFEFGAFLCAMFVLLTGAVRLDEAYADIEWKIIMLVGSLLPLRLVLEREGFTGWFGDGLELVISGQSPAVSLALLSLIALVITQFLDSIVTVVLLVPVAIQIALHLGTSPHPLVMGVTLASSLAFLTPYSSRVHLLILGPGAYTMREFVRVGLPLITILYLVLVGTIGLYFGYW